MPTIICQWQTATNDSNGNPRRLFVYWDMRGDIIGIFDEGYRGKPTDKDIASFVERTGKVRQGGAVVQITPVSITVSEYLDTISYGKRCNVFFDA